MSISRAVPAMASLVSAALFVAACSDSGSGLGTLGAGATGGDAASDGSPDDLVSAAEVGADAEVDPEAGRDVGGAVDGTADAMDGSGGEADVAASCATNDDCAAAFPGLGTCELAVCGSTGACRVGPAKDYAECEDGNACSAGDHCLSGACIGGPAPACFDDNPCTDDGCDPAFGCVFRANLAACDDGDACTEGDSCRAGACAGTARVCDDGDACTMDGCDAASGCAVQTIVCDDGDACTDDGCDSDSGCSAVLVSCDDGNPCTADACDAATGCAHVPGADCGCQRYGFEWTDGYGVVQRGTFDVLDGAIVDLAFEYVLFLAGSCADLASPWCHFPGRVWTVESSDFTALTPRGFHLRALSEFGTQFVFYREDWAGVPAIFLYKPVGSQNTTAFDPNVLWTGPLACDSAP